MSATVPASAARTGGAPAKRTLAVLTFEAGDHVFAVRAQDVEKILGPGQPVPEGTTVVDVVGLLAAPGARVRRGCLVVLSREGAPRPPVALTAFRAREVTQLDPDALLPLPGYLFRGQNPFLGLVPPRAWGGDRAVFLIEGPERLLAAAETA